MSVSASAKPYELVELDVPRNWMSFANAINRHGEAVGTVVGDFNDPAKVRACRWMADGTRIDLDSGLGKIQGYAINGNREVAGSVITAHTPAIAERAVTWNEAGILRILPSTDLPGLRESAMSINDQGWIVGNALKQDGPCHAFLWLPVGQPRELISPTGGYCAVSNINNKGEAVGYAVGEAGFGIFWNDLRVPRRLQGIGSRAGAVVYGINDQGDISGMSFVHGKPETVATLWKAATGQAIELPSPPGLNRCAAFATLSNGLTVGEGRGANGYGTALVWKGKTVQPLSDLLELNGWRLETARAINQRGDIVGMGRSPRGLLAGFLARSRGGPAGE